MRLSEIGADRAMDVLGVLIPRVVAIATDRRVADALRAAVTPGTTSTSTLLSLASSSTGPAIP